MEHLDIKLKVLSDVARLLNERGLTWAVGASLLLYFNGKIDRFNDIDIMVAEGDVDALRAALLQIGTLAPPNRNRQYKTRHFLEFSIQGVDVDVMAGFVIVKDGIEYDCPFSPEHIARYIQVKGEEIPLQSLQDWRRYYQLMGRQAKVEMIDG